MEQFIVEQEQQIPVHAQADVLVVGGGPAGLCAAVSAARNGAQVILMERYGYLGGMATGGYVLLLDCLCDGKGNLIIKGLVEEIVQRLRKVDGIIEPPKEVSTGGEDKIVRYSPVIDPEMMKCVANEMVLETNVKPLFHAWFSKAYVEDGVVKGAIFESKSGRRAVLAKAVIDCTGDGDVFYTAGENYHTGNLPLGLIFRVGNVDCETAERFLSDEDRSRKVTEDLQAIKGCSGGYSFGELPMGFYMRSSINNVVWFNTTTQGSAVNIEDLARTEIEIRQAMMRTMEYFRKNVPGFEHAVVIDTAPQCGVRSSRMLDGEYLITREELMAGARFDDTVVVAQPPYKKFEVSDGLKEIPYRCFLPKTVKGLLVAGRCISGDFGAIEMLRVIPTAMLMGEACGVAAALAVKQGVDVKEVNVREVQERLRRQNVLLP